jgi:hypothetical protein
MHERKPDPEYRIRELPSSPIPIYSIGSGMKLSVKAADIKPRLNRLYAIISNRINARFRMS